LAEAFHQRAVVLEKQGKSIIYLQVGQPSTPAPRSAIDAITQQEHDEILGYTGAAGIDVLRERLSRDYAERYGVDVDPRRIIITIGASGALLLTLIGAFERGARVALPQPFYYAYRHAMPTVGVEPVLFYPSMEGHFQPTVKDLETIEGQLDGLIFASPGNPTGSMMPRDQMGEIAAYCESRFIRMVSDEIYHGIIYDDDVPETTALSVSDSAIVINSFSKYYSMPGWRLGWMVVPENMVESITNLAHNLYISPSAPSQVGALAALDCRDELDGHVVRYKRNRDILVRELPKIGFDRFTAPNGAFYLYCHVAHLHEDSVAFATEMLESCGVLTTPGTSFSPAHGHHFLRMSYAGSTEDIEEAVARLKRWRVA
jgi:aspartate/methionine/tyrosine aminotransferase